MRFDVAESASVRDKDCFFFQAEDGIRDEAT